VITISIKEMNMQQTKKTNERRDRIAAQNAAIVRRNMPQVTYSVDHPGRHEALRSVLAGLRPMPVSETSRLPEEALLTRMCRQGRWDALQAAMWIHRHLLALIPDAGDLDADTLDAKYREVTAAIAPCGSVREIRTALNMGR
jgi:hypothetical protein